MSFDSPADAPITLRANRGASPIWIFAGLCLLMAAAGGVYLYFANGLPGSAGAQSDTNTEARSYRTTAKLELREQASQSARVVAGLREGTTVSAIPAGQKDGVEWLEVTAVDGTKGFAPKSLLRELGPATASDRIRGGTRRLVVSTTVNLRETPSLSGRIIGIADGGTRLVADGMLQSEGEDWLRVPIDSKTTAFIMQRFTTFDDDAGNGDGIEGSSQSSIGVRGFATQITNVQATPLPDSRVVRALQIGEEVRIIGQTNAGEIWYVLRLADGSQGFAPRNMFRLDPNASRWVYPDGTEAPGPNIPKGSTTPLSAAPKSQQQAPSTAPNSDSSGTAQTGETPQTAGPQPTESNPTANAPPAPGAPINLQPTQ